MILHKELSYKIVGCCYNVRNRYGMYHREKLYHKGIEEEFTICLIPFFSKIRVPIHSLVTGKIISYIEPDIIVDNKIIIEIKAKPFIAKDDEMQLIEYLKTSYFEVAYLINFGEREFKPRRFIHTKDKKQILFYPK